LYFVVEIFNLKKVISKWQRLIVGFSMGRIFIPINPLEGIVMQIFIAKLHAHIKCSCTTMTD
jgi:hypothetical protein